MEALIAPPHWFSLFAQYQDKRLNVCGPPKKHHQIISQLIITLTILKLTALNLFTYKHIDIQSE